MQAPISFDSEKLNKLLEVDFKPSHLPATVKKVKFRAYYILLIILFLGIAVTLEVLKNPKEHEVFAEKMGIYDFEGLRFHNFKVDSEIVDNKIDFYLKGSIVNISDRKIKLPVIHVKAYSQGGRVMAENKISLSQEYIEPFSQMDIAPEITRISGNADKLELSFENWIEAILR
jgi:hypothetical protein